MTDFKKINNIAAWAIFGVALIVYMLTMERTASFWDCGEFIACSYKLEVPHPPGAPLFLLIGRMFSFLAMGDVTSVAYWINFASVLASAFSILFLFWTITLLGLKLLKVDVDKNPSAEQTMLLLAAGTIGSLAYTFSDSFWFSAVEAEVYAMSSFFTAFVFWAILKWERIQDPSAGNRWLIMIAYTVGLSIGVHLLNLVTLPVLALMYYYKKYSNPNALGVIISLVIGGAFTLSIMEGVITGLPSIAGGYEIIFVNSFGMPFGTGVIFFLILFIGLIVTGLIYTNTQGDNKVLNAILVGMMGLFLIITLLASGIGLGLILMATVATLLVIYHKEIDKATLNTIILSFVFILVGYTSYGIALVRSNYSPPINENDPSDIMKFISYLKREQYGSRPLMYGPHYNANFVEYKKGNPKYRVNKETGKYEVYDHSVETVYEPDDYMLLPRIYSTRENHPALYQSKLDLAPGEDPTMGNNLSFMFSHQIGHMYMRYLYWNFVGRAGDEFNSDTILFGESDLPPVLENNKARNRFYGLPLILGLLGLIFLGMRSQQTMFVTILFFFLTGLALVIYLNSPPVEPRERDYIYAGSFYAYAIWIGFGVMFLAELFRNIIKNYPTATVIATVIGLAIPSVMAVEGWDDHNRANRYHSVDSAKNLLNSCAPNAILFTGGDNDTFPLWYVQEVEGFRTDVRVCNLSLLGTDWYIDQMKMQAYESTPLPIKMPKERYFEGTNDQIIYPYGYRIATNISEAVREKLEVSGMNLYDYIRAIENDSKLVRGKSASTGDELTLLPSKKLVVEYSPEAVKKAGFVPKKYQDQLNGKMSWILEDSELDPRRKDPNKFNYLFKHHLMILAMIANNAKEGWKRPIYFSSTLSQDNYLNLKSHLQLEGLAYRLLPVKVAQPQEDGMVNTDLMYKNMMPKKMGGRKIIKEQAGKDNFHWREMANENVYYDENYMRFVSNARNSYNRLAIALLSEGKKDKAKKVINYCLKILPDKTFPYDYYVTEFVRTLFLVGEEKQALKIAQTMCKRADQMLGYLSDNDLGEKKSTDRYTSFLYIQKITSLVSQYAQDKTKPFENYLDRACNRFPADCQ